VPSGADVVVELRSLDVVHSFRIPSLRIKQDLYPGRTVRRAFRTEAIGRFEIRCAHLCGQGHTLMRADLCVQTREGCAAWLARRMEEQGGEFDPDENPDLEIWKRWSEAAVDG